MGATIMDTAQSQPDHRQRDDRQHSHGVRWKPDHHWAGWVVGTTLAIAALALFFISLMW